MTKIAPVVRLKNRRMMSRTLKMMRKRIKRKRKDISEETIKIFNSNISVWTKRNHQGTQMSAQVRCITNRNKRNRAQVLHKRNYFYSKRKQASFRLKTDESNKNSAKLRP